MNTDRPLPRRVARSFDGPARARNGRRDFARGVAIAVVGSLLVAGCQVRVATPPPPPPVPGPLEVVRQDAAVTSAGLAVDAGRAADASLDERQYAVLERVSLDAQAHVEALGGVYSTEEGGVVDTATIAGDDEADDEAQDSDALDAPLVPVNPADLVVALTTAAASARAAADQVTDAPLAQLLVVIATSRLLAADALARNLDADRPDLGAGLPTAVPSGLGGAELAAVVVAEDQAAFAFEMIAARSADGVRNRALAAAQRHRATSDAWTRLAGLDEPGLDPRSVSYALGGALESEESRNSLGASVESALVTTYTALLPLAAPGHRAELALLHTLATESARRWGEPSGELPGLD